MNEKNNSPTICNSLEITLLVVGLGYNSPQHRKYERLLLGALLGAMLCIPISWLLWHRVSVPALWATMILFVAHAVLNIVYRHRASMETLVIGTQDDIPVRVSETNVSMVLNEGAETESLMPFFDSYGYLAASETPGKEFMFLGYADAESLGYLERYIKENQEDCQYFRKLSSKIGVILWMSEREKRGIREMVQSTDAYAAGTKMLEQCGER